MKPSTSPATSCRLASAVLAAALAGLAACGDSRKPAGAQAAAEPSPAVAEILLDAEPPGAISVAEARRIAQPGQAITVTGAIGGAEKPFTEGYATLVLADAGLEFCHLIPGDDCPTPWDACCADPDSLKAGRLSIQILDKEGHPAPGSMRGAGGMAELDHLVVTGMVSADSTPDNLVIHASGIYRKPKS